MLKVAEKLRGRAKFIIVGASSGRVSREYFKKLSRSKSEKYLENVELLRYVDFMKLLELYGKTKNYLHSMRNEDFGISVVEAMSAGLVPIVHRSGGPWEDILKAQQGLHEFSYSTLEEAVEIIRELIENESLKSQIAERNLIYAH